ncbi:hypothetical protein LTR64_000806 [Lithohypha guttulata]|uniref:uncharacterized protein n=1 Tax=Lithohypha guttulata TaxID=1690604 RepID=UPI002DDE5B7D|nr:hypothetical protein LTR51_005428 [Lithohypha guttulata]
MTTPIPLPPYILLASSIGLCLSTTFTVGSLGFSVFAIPAILLPSNAPLMPPLELVTEKSKRQFNTEQAPKQPLDSGVGSETESLLDAGATGKVLRRDGGETGSPSSSSYLLRQWFHLFSKGMHNMPPAAIGSAVCYAFCAAMLPGSLENILVKRGLYVLATTLSAGAMVFTLTALKPINEALHERVKEVVAQEQGSHTADVDDKRRETESLIREWGRMNAIRSTLPVMAVLSAMVALVV